jgi:hypothetical protein
MKTTTRLWTFLRRNWDTILTMLIAAPIAILSYFQTVESQVVSTTILSVLFLIACGLLVNRETNNRLQQTTEKVWDRMQKPPTEDIIIPYRKWMEDIENHLNTAREVWILSRTCTRFWEDFNDQLRELLDRQGSLRLLLVDPRNGALRMIANTIELARAQELSGHFTRVTIADGSNRLFQLRSRVEDFVYHMATISKQVGDGRLALRMIDYLPAHTLVIINGSSEHGIIFIELGTFHANGRNRPTFSLLKSKDKLLFNLYHEEFRAMWDSACPVDDLLEAKSNDVSH